MCVVCVCGRVCGVCVCVVCVCVCVYVYTHTYSSQSVVFTSAKRAT